MQSRYSEIRYIYTTSFQGHRKLVYNTSHITCSYHNGIPIMILDLIMVKQTEHMQCPNNNADISIIILNILTTEYNDHIWALYMQYLYWWVCGVFMYCPSVFPPITLQLLLLFMEIIRLLHPLGRYIVHVLSTPRLYGCLWTLNSESVEGVIVFMVRKPMVPDDHMMPPPPPPRYDNSSIFVE